MAVYFPPETDQHTALTDRGGPATILLVEDEPALLKLARRLLVRAGFAVVAHAGPVEALGWWATGVNSETIDVVVTDVAMPGMSGPEMLRQMRGSRPALAALLVSGNPNYRRMLGEVKDPFLMKPYTPAEFVDAVRAVLAAQPPRDRA